MNSGSKDTGRWKQQWGSSAQQSMCPAGGCPAVPPSTGHLAPDTQFPFLDLTGAKGRGMGWPGQHPRWETAGWNGQGVLGSRAALRLGAAKAVSRDAAGLRSLGSARERSCLWVTALHHSAQLPSLPNCLEYYIIIPLSSLCFLGFFLPHWLFHRSPKYLLLKGGSCGRWNLGLMGACQPQPAPTATMEKHLGCGLLFSTHSIGNSL